MIEFKNLEEINLSHNNISDIKPLLKFKTLKKVDLSFNKINNINILKEIIETNKSICQINLSNNNINKENNLKEIIYTREIEINLDNNLILKDIEDIKNVLKKNKNTNNDVDDISSNSIENRKLILISRKKNINHNLRYQMIDSIEQNDNEILMIKSEKENINKLKNEEKNSLLIPISDGFKMKKLIYNKD